MMKGGFSLNQEFPLLEVKNLQAYIPTPKGEIKPVHDVSFSINPGEILALVGESGSGKTVTALSIMGLNASSIKYRENSVINFKGKNLLDLKEKEMIKLRGKEISMIFQDPMFSLNPLHRIGKQIAEKIQIHENVKYKEAKKTVIDLLTKVGIPDAEARINDYPHQLSGGMRQRVMIAMALACHPSLLIADEPTTALDVTIQAQILNLIRKIQDETGVSVLLITHDLGVVAETADRVIVMYCGKIVEEGTVYEVFENPLHPYTKGLMESIPELSGPSRERLDTIPGTVPNPLELPKGCNFCNRCSFATEKCRQSEPPLTSDSSSPDRLVACWHPLKKEGEVNLHAGTASFS